MPGNFDGLSYDPNALLKGAAAAQAFGQLLGQNKAAADFNPNDTTQSQADLNSTGQYTDANALQDRPAEVAKAAANLAQTQQSTATSSYELDSKKQQDEAAKALEVTTYLRNAKSQGQDPVAAFDSLSPYLSSELGLDPQHAAAIRQQLATNPDFLDQTHEQLLGVAGDTIYDKNAPLSEIQSGKAVYTPPSADKGKMIQGQDGGWYNVVGTVATPVTVNGDPTGAAPVPSAAVGIPGTTPAQATGGVLTEGTFAQKLQSILPGAVITSGQRTAAQNAAVGGVANSNHLTGQAADVTPPAGTSMAQLNQLMQAQGYHTVPEKGNKPVSNPALADHIHVDFNGQHGSQPSVPAVTVAGTPSNTGPGGQLMGKTKAGQAGTDTDPALIEHYADQVMHGAKRAAIVGGRGGDAAQALWNAVETEGRAKYGSDFDEMGAQSDYHANTQSLAGLTQRTNILSALESTVNNNIAVLQTYLKKGSAPDGTPDWLAPTIQQGRLAVHDPDVSALYAAARNIGVEYGKYQAGGTGQAAPPVEALRAATELTDPVNLTKAQILSNIDVIKKDIAGQKKAYADQIDAVNNKIHGGYTPTPTTAKKFTYDSKGNLVAQ